MAAVSDRRCGSWAVNTVFGSHIYTVTGERQCQSTCRAHPILLSLECSSGCLTALTLKPAVGRENVGDFRTCYGGKFKQPCPVYFNDHVFLNLCKVLSFS